MVMITIHHILVHGLGLSALQNEGTLCYGFSVFLLNAFCVVGVNCFFFISGFFGISFSEKKIIYLWLECVFYTFLWTLCLSAISGVDTVSFVQLAKEGVKIIVPFLTDYWFIPAYFFLCILSPVINNGLDVLTKESYVKIVVSLLFINTIFGFGLQKVGFGTGYTALQGLYMYILGYIAKQRKDNFIKRINKFKCFSVYFVCSVVVACAAFLFAELGNGNWSWRIFSYYNPIIVCGSVALSMCFCFWEDSYRSKRFYDKCSKLSRYSLAIYLITDYTRAREIVFYPITSLMGGVNTNLIVWIVIPVYAIVLSAVCCIIDIPRYRVFLRLKNKNIGYR